MEGVITGWVIGDRATLFYFERQNGDRLPES